MANPFTALICGISGQDGSYLAQLLLQKGYRVVGTSRDAQVSAFCNLMRLGIRGEIEVASMALGDFRSVLQVLARYEPDEIYNLAGQSSVGLSFEQPVETLDSISVGTLNLLEAVRFLGRDIRLYNAGSSEQTPFRPRSPYAVAKAAAFWQVANYREAYGLRLRLCRLDIQRDWGLAQEYVEAMWKMLQQPQPDDFVIATGESHSLQDFVAVAFGTVNLDWRDHVDTDATLIRPADIGVSGADASHAEGGLGWKAKTCMLKVARAMVLFERERPSRRRARIFDEKRP